MSNTTLACTGPYEITNAEPRCYTVEYSIQTVYIKLQIMLSQGATQGATL